MRYVYIARQGTTGPVKIGSTNNPGTRMSALKSKIGGEAFVVLRLIEGSYKTEHWLQKEFEADHLTGEWFSFNRRMMDIQIPNQDQPLLIQEMIKRSGLFQYYVAEQIGLKESRFSYMLSGRRGFPYDKILPLAQILNVPKEDIEFALINLQNRHQPAAREAIEARDE